MEHCNETGGLSRAERIRLAREECERVLEYTPRAIVDENGRRSATYNEVVREDNPVRIQEEKKNVGYKELKKEMKKMEKEERRRIKEQKREEESAYGIQQMIEEQAEDGPGVVDSQESMKKSLKHSMLRFVIAGALLLFFIGFDRLAIKNNLFDSRSIKVYVTDNMSIDQIEGKITDFIENKVFPVFKSGDNVTDEETGNGR